MEKGEKGMRFKNKWLNRVTAAVLSIGMILTPAVMDSGVTYADVKDIESPIPVTQSEEAKAKVSASQTQKVMLGDKEYEITAKMIPDTYVMMKGDEKELEVVLTSDIEDATSSNAIAAVSNGFTWESSADNLIVSDSKTNKATMTCTETYGLAVVTASVDIEGVNFQVGIDVLVEEYAPKKPDVVLSPIEIITFVRRTEQLNVEFFDCEDLETKIVGYSSSNPDVATVDENGLIRAVGIGTATVTGTFKIGDKEYRRTCEITVNAEDTDTPVTPEVPEITLSKTELLLFHGWNQGKEKVEVTPADRDYEWESSNSEIAFGGSDGYVYAGRKAGTATITVTDKETKKSASIQVR